MLYKVYIIIAADVHFDKIQLIQNDALRIVMQSPRYTLITDLHDCTGSQPIKTHLISDAKHRLQIMQNNSPLIHKVILEYQAHQHIQTMLELTSDDNSWLTEFP